MFQEYDVCMADKPVGKAQVERQGLYYSIQIRCDIPGDIMHKVLLRCGKTEQNLGVLVPMEGRFGIDMKIPVKQTGEGELVFVILPRHRELRGKFVPIAPEEPFRYLSRLKNSFMERRGPVQGIVIMETDRR